MTLAVDVSSDITTLPSAAVTVYVEPERLVSSADGVRSTGTVPPSESLAPVNVNVTEARSANAVSGSSMSASKLRTNSAPSTNVVRWSTPCAVGDALAVASAASKSVMRIVLCASGSPVGSSGSGMLYPPLMILSCELPFVKTTLPSGSVTVQSLLSALNVAPPTRVSWRPSAMEVDPSWAVVVSRLNLGASSGMVMSGFAIADSKLSTTCPGWRDTMSIGFATGSVIVMVSRGSMLTRFTVRTPPPCGLAWVIWALPGASFESLMSRSSVVR